MKNLVLFLLLTLQFKCEETQVNPNQVNAQDIKDTLKENAQPEELKNDQIATDELNEEEIKKMEKQINELKKKLEGQDLKKLLEQLSDFKYMTCVNEVDTEMNNQVDILNKLGSGTFARKMIKKISYQLFGLCVEKFDMKNFKKEKNSSKQNLFESYDFTKALEQESTDLNDEEVKWKEQMNQAQKKLSDMKRSKQEGLKFGNQNLTKYPKWKILLISLIIMVPIILIWKSLFGEKLTPQQLRKLKKKQSQEKKKKQK